MSESLAIDLKAVHKRYQIQNNTVHALRGVDFKVPFGRRIAVTGKSGSGKSTLLHIISTLERPTSGAVRLGGKDYSNARDITLSHFRNRTIGFVFQMNNLLPEFSAIENVLMPGLIAQVDRKKLSDRARKLLAAVGLMERMSHRPGELSGGEQQRVAIAQALVLGPKILLADEPTGNLDERTSLEVQDLLLELSSSYEMTMILVTHDPDLAKRLPHQVVMHDGQIVEEGRS